MARLTEVCAIKETTTGKTPTGMVAEYVGSMPNDLLKRVEELATIIEQKGVPKDVGKAKQIKEAFQKLLEGLSGAY